MQQNLQKLFLTSFLTFFLGVSILSFLPAPALAQVKAPVISEKQRCDDFKKKFNVGGMNIFGDAPVFCSASDLLIKIINYLLVISGTVTVLFLIIGGFWYLTSAGNEEQTEKGRKTLVNSIIGLVIIILAYTIVRLVAGTLSGLK